MDLNLAYWSTGISTGWTSSPQFTNEELEYSYMDFGSDTSNSHPEDLVYEPLGGSATPKPPRIPSTVNIIPPLQLDNELKDNDFSNNIVPNYSSDDPVHTFVRTTPAKFVSRISGEHHYLRQNHTGAPTGPQHQSTLSTSTIRDALSEHTVPPTTEIPTIPRAVSSSAISHESEATAQMAMDNHQNASWDQGRTTDNNYNNTIDANIDPNLPPTPTLTVITTPPQNTQTNFARESTHPVLLDRNPVQAQNSEVDPNTNHHRPSSRRPSTRQPPRTPRLESSRGNTEREGEYQSAGSRSSTTPVSRTQHGENSSHVGSISSASSYIPQKCVLHILSKELFARISDLQKGYQSDLLGPLEIDIRDAIIDFYDRNAFGEARPSEVEESLLDKISDKGVKGSLSSVVDWVDKTYFKAEWRLKPGLLVPNRAHNPTLDAHSTPSLPRPNERISSSSAKRRPESPSGTSPPDKRPCPDLSPPLVPEIANSAPGSLAPTPPSQTIEQFKCPLCVKSFKKDKYLIKHHDTHLPPVFWACAYGCEFTANSWTGMDAHHREASKHEGENKVTKEQMKENKFYLRDGGHEYCPYCGIELVGKDGTSRDSAMTFEHLAKHFKEPIEARAVPINHRCTVRNGVKCGDTDYWKTSQFYSPENRIPWKGKVPVPAAYGYGIEGGDGEDGQGPGGSVSRGNGGRAGGSRKGGNDRGMGGGNSGGRSRRGARGERSRGGMGGRNNERPSGGEPGMGKGRGRGRGRGTRQDCENDNEGGITGRPISSMSTAAYSASLYGASGRDVLAIHQQYPAPRSVRRSSSVGAMAGRIPTAPYSRSKRRASRRDTPKIQHHFTTPRSVRGSPSAEALNLKSKGVWTEDEAARNSEGNTLQLPQLDQVSNTEPRNLAHQVPITDLHSFLASSPASLGYTLRSYTDQSTYAVAGNFTPSKSNVPEREAGMDSQMNAIMDPPFGKHYLSG